MNASEAQIDLVKKIVSLLCISKSILFITGAGISAESGLPTYRGIGGLYNDSDTEDGISIEAVLSSEMLRTRPALTWKYLARIEERCRNARFNRAHEVIAETERHFERVWVLTQNIDGFHHAAGSHNVIEIHGNMHRIYCESCSWQAHVEDYSQLKIPPTCPTCKHTVRPAVVFFGEQLPYREVSVIFEEMHKGFDIYFSIGTTSVFSYIQDPIRIAKRRGKPIIEINPEETAISSLADIKLPLKATEAMESLWGEYLGRLT
ncbi:MAG: NAD-dependent protein deacylase [Candidatus Omnitrophota bacterium]